MESQPQNSEFRNNPENFHPWERSIMVVFCFLFFSQNKTVLIRILAKDGALFMLSDSVF